MEFTRYIIGMNVTSVREIGEVDNFYRYRIDAITVFAVPAEGPHGFYTLGK